MARVKSLRRLRERVAARATKSAGRCRHLECNTNIQLSTKAGDHITKRVKGPSSQRESPLRWRDKGLIAELVRQGSIDLRNLISNRPSDLGLSHLVRVNCSLHFLERSSRLISLKHASSFKAYTAETVLVIRCLYNLEAVSDLAPGEARGLTLC